MMQYLQAVLAVISPENYLIAAGNCMMQEFLLFQGTVLQWLLANIVREIAFGPVDHKRELYR